MDDIDASYITGPDDVRARSIRDLLASAKNSLKKRDPALAARLKIPIVDARQSARLNQLLEERTRLLIKADKSLAELDRLRQLKQEIKQLQRDGEMQWARLTGVTISRVVNGQPVEERVPLNPRDFYMHDKLWKVFKHVAANHPGLKFEHIYNFVFEVMVSSAQLRTEMDQGLLPLPSASFYLDVCFFLWINRRKPRDNNGRNSWLRRERQLRKKPRRERYVR